MPKGSLPKPPDERERRNSPAGYGPQVPLRWDGVQRGPDLPLGLPGIKWSTMTLKWWDVWRNSAQAMVMLPTDWATMLETALLVNDYWTPKREAMTDKNGKIQHRTVSRSTVERKALAGEIRQRMALYGATYRDRQLCGMIIDNSSEEEAMAAVVAEFTKQVDYLEILKAEGYAQE